MNVADILNRAIAAYGHGALEESRALCARVLSLDGNNADALNLAGALSAASGEPEAALRHFERVTQLRPLSAESFSNLGVALHRLGRLDDAIASYHRALSLQPAYTDAIYNLGVAHRDAARWEQVVIAMDRVLAVKPQHALAWNERGNALMRLERWPEAALSYDRALALAPHMVDALAGRSSVRLRLLDPTGALRDAEAAVRIAPDHVYANHMRGLALDELQQHDAALESCERALRLKPDYPSARWAVACMLLRNGDYERGWELYESRWALEAIKATAAHYDVPLWLGDASLRDATIVLHQDQGLGDMIHFARYIPRVARQASKVIVQVPAPVVPLLASSFPDVQVVESESALPPHDFHCPLGSLPLAFGTRGDTIPAQHAYLQVSEARRAAWKERLGPRTRPRIGLAWSGNPMQPKDRQRSIPLDQLRPLLGLDVEFHALQKEMRDADREIAGNFSNLFFWGESLLDFSDTAALAQEMDIAICVDTGPAHVAAAVGAPTWILLPATPDWRWMLGREDSPWYPTVRLFRQPARGDWESVITRVREALCAMH